MKYHVKPQGICPTDIDFDLNGDVVTDIVFTKGCNGNLKALSKLLDGFTVQEIEEKLKGNTCGDRGTSCADQLARAVRAAYEESRQQ